MVLSCLKKAVTFTYEVKKLISCFAWIILAISVIKSLYLISLTLFNSGDLWFALMQQADQMFKPLVIWSLLMIVSNSYKSDNSHN